MCPLKIGLQRRLQADARAALSRCDLAQRSAALRGSEMTMKLTIENGAGLRTDATRAELDRVLASQTFAKSPRLSGLLTYICEHSLEGRVGELSEQQIGINIFGRQPGYNSAE